MKIIRDCKHAGGALRPEVIATRSPRKIARAVVAIPPLLKARRRHFRAAVWVIALAMLARVESIARFARLIP